MTEILLSPTNDLQKLSQALFLSLSPAQAKQPQPPPIEEILQCDASIADALKLARAHQINHRRIEALKEEVLALEARLMDVWTELEQGRRELEAIIEEGDERITAIKKAKEASIPYPDLLTYAQTLSAFTSAPPNMPETTGPGLPPPPLFFPPFPNEEKMRRGRLNAEAPLGPLGETHSVGRPPTASPEKPELTQAILPPHANPYRHDHRPQQQFFDLDLDLNPD
ncbi:hypothetical protein BD410DRAFT_684242, partial [Rickenella mellea]